jgi:hypothetical protein
MYVKKKRLNLLGEDSDYDSNDDDKEFFYNTDKYKIR